MDQLQKKAVTEKKQEKQAVLELEDWLVVVGFAVLAVGLIMTFGPGIAASICGAILFLLGMGLAVYKGR